MIFLANSASDIDGCEAKEVLELREAGAQT